MILNLFSYVALQMFMRKSNNKTGLVSKKIFNDACSSNKVEQLSKQVEHPPEDTEFSIYYKPN